MPGALEPLQSGDASPPSPLRTGTPGSTANKALGRASAQRPFDRIAMQPLVPEAPRDDEHGEPDPCGNRDREHDESDVENEAVHHFVVVVPASPALPRTGDPRCSHNSRNDVRLRLIRVFGDADERT